MVRKYTLVSMLLLVLIVDVQTQYFDFFQGFQPIAYPTTKPSTRRYASEITTKRPKTDTNRRAQPINRRNPAISLIYEDIDRDDNIRQSSKEKQHKRKQTTISPIFNLNFFSTTVKPARKTTKINNPSHSNFGVNNSNNQNDSRISKPKNKVVTNGHLATNYDVYNSDTGNGNDWYERPVINNIGEDYYTPRPNYEVTNKHNSNNYDYNQQNYENSRPTNHNSYTTKNPFYNRPGVKPAVIENRPPITNRPNRPTTQRPTTTRPTTKRPFSIPSRPTDAGSIAFPGDEEGPQIIAGPDEDYMSEAEKRRYIEISERMCEKYKSLNTKQLQAIPLIPSPEPVQVNVTSCAPTTIPLVVGGRVVNIKEFPHMVLLGWMKLEGGGYSWKCGGSLISDQYVLTAAHCAYQERDNTVVIGPPRAVQLGSSYLDDPGALVIKVASVVRHPKYKSPKSYYDLALLKLASPVTFSEVIRPACLGAPPSVGSPVIATGWGQTEFAGDQSQELRSVSLPVWNMEQCHNVLGTSRKLPNGPSRESQLCAGEPNGGKDTCQGDSGGPAQIQDGCLWRVVAVTSLGRSCGAPHTPGLYSTVKLAFIAAQVFGGHTSNRNNQQRKFNLTDSSSSNNKNYNYNNQESSYNNNYRTNTAVNTDKNRVNNDDRQDNYNNNSPDNTAAINNKNNRNNYESSGYDTQQSNFDSNFGAHNIPTTNNKNNNVNNYENSNYNNQQNSNYRTDNSQTDSNGNQRTNYNNNDSNQRNHDYSNNNRYSTESPTVYNNHQQNNQQNDYSNYYSGQQNSPRYYENLGAWWV